MTDEIAIGVAKFITRYRSYPDILSYSFKEAYERSFFLGNIEIDEDLILLVKEGIKKWGLDAPIGNLFQSTTQ